MKESKTEKLFFLSLTPSAFILMGFMAIFLIVLANKSLESFMTFGWLLLTDNVWDPENERYGVLGPLFGTFITSSIATAFALLFSIPLSVFITDFLKGKSRELFTSLVELMGGIPTIIFATWAMNYLASFMKEAALLPLHEHFGFIPLFSCRPIAGFSIFTAGIAIGISLIPYTTSIISASYRMIPTTYKEACLGIGATRYETAKILLSLLRPAIAAATLLSLARGAGETIIAVATVGNAMTMGGCLVGPGYTVSALIAAQYANASLYKYAESVLYFAALIVLTFTLFLSFLGLSLLEKWRVKVVV